MLVVDVKETTEPAQLANSESAQIAHTDLAPTSDDTELAATIRQQLHNIGYSQMRLLRVDVEQGRVALSGKVSRYYLRQVAQSVVLQVPGVKQLNSNVFVERVENGDEQADGF